MMAIARRLVVIAFVLLTFAFFATAGTMRFHTIVPGKTHIPSLGADYYPRLADAFLHGHAALSETRDSRLSQVSDPYDPGVLERAKIGYLWDASYYRGAYYLYFSPVPALLFHIPMRLITGGYPDDDAAGMFFSSWAFLMAALFAVRALSKTTTYVPLEIWLLFLAFGNVIAFSLPCLRTYEVAAMAGMAMSATWAVALLRFVERRSLRSAAWVGIWLALAIATRANLALLLIPTAAAILLPWERRRSAAMAVAAAIPLAVAGIAYGAYNAARFGDPFESGHKYQLSWQSAVHRSFCSLHNTKDAVRFAGETLHYTFWTPRMWAQFPYVQMLPAQLDPQTTFAVGGEQAIGVMPVAPLAGVASVLAALLACAPLPAEPRRRAAVLIMAGSWLVLFGLATCRWVVARYSLDFMLLMTMATAVCVEAALTLLGQWNTRVRVLRAAVSVLAVYSIVIGALLGFEGTFESFRIRNPALWKSIGATLHVNMR